MKFVIFNILFLCTLSSCALFQDDPRSGKSTEYDVTFSDSLWTPMSPDMADAAYLNNSTASIITTNSQCKKYEKLTLDQLGEKILSGSGIEGVEILGKKNLTFSERDALRIEAKGKADGHKAFLSILTLKKNRCIYDFILVSNTEKNFRKDLKTFEIFLTTVKIK